ncbi:MAG: endolytic transglycosylase MltG, partial [Gammaproteobacteria bacterium]
MLKRIVVFLSIPLLLLSAFAGLLYLHLQQTTDADLAFDIPRGDNLSSIVQRLQGNQSLPVDGAVFKALALLTRDEGPVLAGQYQILKGMTAMDLLTLFRSGKVIQYRITFPEGWRLSDWLNAMDDAPYKAQVAKVLGLEHDPEGWFFPDTYQYVKGDSDVTILGMALERMAQVLDEEWSRRGMVSHLESPTDALTLASIIEKETGFEPDRPVVASVFHNRLM